LLAVGEKVSNTTNERKVMSKKTFFKRIALTATVALGFGMLSVAPSNAVVSGESLTIGALSTDTTTTYASTIAVNETATAVMKHTWVSTSRNNESVTVTATRLSAGTGTLRMTLTDSSSSVGQYDQPEYMASGALNAVNLIGTSASQLNSGAASAVTEFTVSDSAGTAGSTAVNSTISLRFIAPSVAGTYNFVVSTGIRTGTTDRSGSSVTWTVTVTAADVLATAASTSTLRTGTALRSGGTKEGTDSSVVASRATTVTTAAATIWVEQKNSASTANESMTVTVSGPAWVNTDSATRPTSGTAITIRNLGPIGGSNISSTTQTPIFVWSNGTAGTATITVSTISGTVLGTETVKFYGNVTSIVVDTTYRKILRAGGFASQPTIDIYATDAAGVARPGLSFSMVSSTTSAVNSITSGACSDLDGDGYPGYYSCVAETTSTSVSGNAATLTYRVVNPAITTSTAYFTLDHAVTLGGSASTITLTSDKANYAPGEVMVITATAKDSSGNPVWDGASGPTTASLAANKSLGGTVTMNLYYDGVSTSQVRNPLNPRAFTGGNLIYAPNASGAFTVTHTYGTLSEKTAVLTATVGDDGAITAANAASDAAAEAIDAANAATDAANLAAEAADAATVAAEEARDAADAATAAVEALASEVATLMAALKAQITTLANTVAKIAKKVKA
jgi:hypothetical protein